MFKAKFPPLLDSLLVFRINHMNKRKEIVPNNLKEYRLKAGFTQKEVARKIGVNNEERVCHWEKGRNMPNLISILKLCKLYDTTPGEIYPDF